MSDHAFGLLTLGALVLAAVLFIGAALYELRIDLFLSGVRELSVNSLRSRAGMTPEENKRLRAAVRDHRALALTPGADIDPYLRHLYVRERWTRRCAWAAALLLITSILTRPAGV